MNLLPVNSELVRNGSDDGTQSADSYIAMPRDRDLMLGVLDDDRQHHMAATPPRDPITIVTT